MRKFDKWKNVLNNSEKISNFVVQNDGSGIGYLS